MTNWKKKCAALHQANIDQNHRIVDLNVQLQSMREQRNEAEALANARRDALTKKFAEVVALCAHIEEGKGIMSQAMERMQELLADLRTAEEGRTRFAERIAELQPIAQETSHSAVTALRLMDVLALRTDRRAEVDQVEETTKDALVELLKELRDTAEKALRTPTRENTAPDAEDFDDDGFPDIFVVLDGSLG